MPFELKDAIKAAGIEHLTLEQVAEFLGGDGASDVRIHVTEGRVAAVESPSVLDMFLVVYDEGEEETFCYPSTRPSSASSGPVATGLEAYLSAVVRDAAQSRSRVAGELSYDDYLEHYGPVTVVRFVAGRVAGIQSCGDAGFVVEYADGETVEFTWPATQA
jgi:hypothetical protein